MKIDEFDFEHTARAVYIMNPSARERYDSWEDLRSYMIFIAHTPTEATSISTGGFQLTFFKGYDGETNCRASVSAYVALKYAEKMEKEAA